jgi:four helix bundle protein
MRRSYETLIAWQLAHQLAIEVSVVVRGLSREERIEVGGQLRRAALSVPTNLVEGRSGFGPRIYLRHVRIALSSAAEVDYLLRYAEELGCLQPETAARLADLAWKTRGLVYLLAKSLQRKAG